MNENKDLNNITEEEIMSFYKSAGIVINELCKRVKGFKLMSNYKNLLEIARNGELLKDNLVKYFKIYSNNFTEDDTRYKDNMVNIIGKGNFKLSIQEYSSKYENLFLLECGGMNINK